MTGTYRMAPLAAACLMMVACSQQASESEVPAAVAASDTASASCDRDCILGIGQRYLAALVAHDPTAAPLADDLVFVEDIRRLNTGDGLWQSIASAPSDFQLWVPDPDNGTVGYLGMMTRMAAPPAPSEASAEERAVWAETVEKTEQPVMVALRLKVEDGLVTEAEHLTTGIREPQMANLQTPRPGLLAEVPADSRMSTSSLITMGYSYYDALDDNDGTLMPFAADCERHENGMVTAGGNAGAGPNGAGSGSVARDCAGQLTSRVMSYIDRIENRRVFAADPVTGLVMGLSHFRHPMDGGPYEVTNMDGTTEMREMTFAPFDLPAAHIFKIGADQQVHEIEAMGFMAPYNAPTGWED